MGLTELQSPSTTDRTPKYFSSWKQATRWIRESVRKALGFMEIDELLEEIAIVQYRRSRNGSWDSIDHRIQELQTEIKYHQQISQKLENELKRLQQSESENNIR